MIWSLYCTETRHPQFNERIGEYVSRQIWGETRYFGPHASMGVFDDDALLGGIIYHNWHPDTGAVEISGAATDKRWMRPRIMFDMYHFAFDLLGTQLVVQRVTEGDDYQVNMLRRFGYDGVLVPRLCGRDKGCWIMTLTDDVWHGTKLAKRYKMRDIGAVAAA